MREARLDDQSGHEADKGQSLDEGGAQDEDREQTALNLGLTGHARSSAVRSQANADAGADNAETKPITFTVPP